MVLSNSTSEPDERTTLLNGNKSNDPSLGDAIKPVEYGNADRDASKNGVEDSGDVDEEAGGAAEENPLFEGNKEMRGKLHILCPAVAIGASFRIPILLEYVEPSQGKILTKSRYSSSQRTKLSS
jgi:hypothetical protein